MPWLACESLEARIALSVNRAVPTLEVHLIPELDAFGDQIETIQIFEQDGLQQSTFAIYDTGASVVTYSANDAQIFDSLEVPHDDDGDGVADGTLKFLDVPVYVLDIVEGIDGIWGMNLLNAAYQFQYDPHDPLGASVTFTFDTDPFRELPLPDPEELSEEGIVAVDFLSTAFPQFAGVLAGPSFPSFETPAIDTGPVLQVGEIEWHAGGVSVELSTPIDDELLNLYDGNDAAFDLPDASLVGEQTGPVSGSMVWDETSGQLQFVKTGGPLQPDNYRFTLFSRSGGLAASSGRLLDGDANGIAGGHFVSEFSVEASTAAALRLPDFVRAAGQTIDLNASGGIPIAIDQGDGVTQFSFALQFDTELLDVTGAVLAPSVPADWQIDIDNSTPGKLLVSAAGLTPLSSGGFDLIMVEAQVPGTAVAGDAQVLELAAVQINQGSISARGDAAVQLVSLLGDATGSGEYSALDASLTARLAVGLDTGFDSFGRFDPLLLADVTGDGTISALDAAFIARKAVGLDQPEIPDLPVAAPPARPSSGESSSTESNLPLSAADLSANASDGEPEPVSSTGGFISDNIEALPPHVRAIFAAAAARNEPATDSESPSTSDAAHDELFSLIGSSIDESAFE